MKTSILEKSEREKSILYKEFEMQFEQMAAYQNLMRIASHKLEILEKALNKMGLDMVEYSTPSFEPFTMTKERNLYDKIIINVTAEKKEFGRFRFLTFRGYNSKGAGLNKNSLDTKAKKMGTIFSEAVNAKCSINPFSLEMGKGNNAPRVLITMIVS